MKKIFTFFLALVANVSAIYASDIEVDGIWYDFDDTDQTAGVTYRGSSYDDYSDEYSGTVVIPSSVTYNGTTYSVTRIGNYAFRVCSSLTSVTIPESITSIGYAAFAGCSKLTSVTIPNSVKSIGYYAFEGCSSLTSVTIPNSVKSIGGSAFEYCSSLTSVTIPESITSIGERAFYECSSLTSMTIPESVTIIGYETFEGCSSLTTVTIGESVTSIGEDAFYGCSSLNSVTINSGAIGNKQYSQDSNLSHIFGSQVTEYVIGDNVTRIGAYAFFNCSSLTSVTIPESVTSIREDAFYGCSSLNSVTIPNSVTTIGDYAFSGCSSLNSVTINSDAIGNKQYSQDSNLSHIFGSQVTEYVIGDNVIGIGSYAFSACSALTSVTIPNSVTSIGGSAFRGCSALTSVTIPNSVTSIGESAFYECSSLTSVTINSDAIVSKAYSYDSNISHIFGSQVTEYVIGDNVIGIGSYAFRGCSSLTSVTIGESVTSIGEFVFTGCSSLTSVTIPNSVTNIGKYAFYGCSSLTSVTIPNSVTSIGESAFYECSSLTSVTIPESVTSIGYETFAGCSALTFVTIPESITSIGDYAFSGCSSLTSVTIPESVTTIGERAFVGCSALTFVTIPNSVTSIGGSAFAGCSALTSVTIPNSVTSIGYRIFEGCSSLTSVTIPNSVTSIGDYAFSGCSSLTSVTIPESVTSIGYAAFNGCSSLTKTNYTGDIAGWCNIGFGDSSANPMCYSHNFYINDQEIKDLVIPESVTSIGDWAFSSCSSLTSVTIGESVTSIGDYAFSGCSSLTSVTINSDAIVSKDYEYNIDDYNFNFYSFNMCDIFGSQVTEYIIGESVTSIGNGAFGGCSQLTSVVIPNSVTSIGESAFYVCSKLTSVDIPNSVTSIGTWAFCFCKSLISITIPNSVTSIGGCAFAYCSSLTSITIPNSVTSIGGEAFRKCSSLTSVTIGESVTSIGHSAFAYCSSLTSITIPNSVTSIGYAAFIECSSLTKTNYTGDIAGWCNIGFGDSSANPMCYSHNFYINDQEIKDLVIPESVTSIGDWAFSSCSSLTSVTIGESVKSIGEYAFDGCSSLTSVTINSDAIVSKAYSYDSNISHIFGSKVTEYIIGESVTSIGYAAFYHCTSLTSVTIPESVTSIGYYAFAYCSSLTSITCKAVTPPTIVDPYTFYDVSTSIPVYVPCESIQSYREHNQWGRFQNLQCVKPEDPNPEDPQDSEMCLNSADERAVFFQGEEFGTSANVYMWDPANDNKELVGSWPGSAATHLGDGKFKFVIPTSVTGDPSTWMIIWNNGIGGTKTKDLTFTMHGLYNMSGVQSVITTLCDGGEIPVDPKPEDPNPENPQDSEMCLNSADERAVFFQGEEFGTSANVYMWDPANDNKELVGSWPGSAATHLGDGKFKFVIPTSVTGDPSTWMIIWNNGIGGTKTKDLTFTMHGLYNMSGVQSVVTTLCDGSNIDDPNEEVITCAEAVSICQQTGTTATTKEYTIRGYVTKIEAVYSEQYDNITFWMADTLPTQMDNSSKSVTSLSDYPNIALGKSTTASSSQDSGTLPEYINDGDFNTRWSSEWQDNEYITIDLEQYSFIDHITLHWEFAYASQFAILITDEQPSSSTLSSPLPSSATCYQSSGDVQTIPVAKNGRYITLIGIERATAYGISLYELEAYGAYVMPLLQAYCVKPIQNTDKYVQIGDYVEAVGTLVNYGGTTPEINAGGTYTILTKHEENGSTSSVENTNTQSPMTNCQKIIRDGQLLILRDGKTYNAMGQEM